MKIRISWRRRGRLSWCRLPSRWCDSPGIKIIKIKSYTFRSKIHHKVYLWGYIEHKIKIFRMFFKFVFQPPRPVRRVRCRHPRSWSVYESRWYLIDCNENIFDRMYSKAFKTIVLWNVCENRKFWCDFGLLASKFSSTLLSFVKILSKLLDQGNVLLERAIDIQVAGLLFLLFATRL